MTGNIVVGIAILAPAGMLAELADGLHVGIHDTGLLVTYGAVVLCIGSPVMAWLTTRLDRRTLLVTTVAIVAGAQVLSALAPNYAVILALRLAMLTVAALYTPQAAATVALIVPEKQRPSAIAFVFLGWSLAIAAGLPLITFLATQFGWRMAFGVLAALAALIAALLFVTLPRGLQGRPLSLLSFAEIARSKRIVSILSVTLLQTAGQFTVFIYFAPLLKALAGASTATVGGFFALYGVVGLAGNMLASAIVTRLGIERTLMMFLGSSLTGLVLWSLGAGSLAAMGAGIFFWALGFSAINSMQQARLAAAAPDLASASIAMNTSLLYVGQAIGSGIGGVLFATGYLNAMGYVGVVFMMAATTVMVATRQRAPSPR